MELIKVLIADDENLAIEDLTDLFDWEGNGFVIIATAKNGEQALQKFNKYSPHIVITDIKMPIMSGIELAKAIRKNSRSTSIVFLSGYAEFEYAKQALDLNVEDYILKNEINAEKLSSKMLEIKSKLFTSDKVRQRTVQGVATEVFNHRKSLDAFAVSPDAIVREFVQGSYYYLIIEEDLPLPFIMLSEDTTEEILPVSIIDFCMSIEDDNFKVMSVCDIKPTRFLLTIRGSCRLTSFNQFAMLKQFAIRLQNKLKGQFQLSCSLFTFPRVLHLDAAYQDYLRLKDRIYSKYLLGTSLILDLEDDLLKGQTENVDYDGTYVQRLIDDRNIIELHNYIDSVFKEILRKKSYPALVLVTRVMLGAIDRNGNELKYIKSGKSFKTYSFKDKTLWLDIHSIKALLKDKFSEINDIFVENSKVQYSREVLKAIAYIREHYSNENLSIKEIATHVSLSTTWLSSVFKKETGITILDFLTEVRIEKAKKLLKTSDSIMYEISRMVGYGSSQYFSQVFYKLTGYTPQNYKKRSDLD